MEYKVFVLKKKDLRFKTEVWIIKGVYSTYEKAQRDFIYRKGLFTIDKLNLDEFIK